LPVGDNKNPAEDFGRNWWMSKTCQKQGNFLSRNGLIKRVYGFYCLFYFCQIIMAFENKPIGWWENEVRKLMAEEAHPEAFFRALLVLTELGDATKYVTHDQKLNPLARPHGSRQEEVLALGQLLIQALSLSVARGVSNEEALEAGLKNWQDRDWKRREAASGGPIKGRVAVPGRVEDVSYVVSGEHELGDFRTGVLVAEFVKPDQTQFLLAGQVRALVTDNGGIMSHPAIIARELGIVAIVGTGNGTKRIPHGVRVLVRAEGDEGIVEVVGK